MGGVGAAAIDASWPIRGFASWSKADVWPDVITIPDVWPDVNAHRYSTPSETNAGRLTVR